MITLHDHIQELWAELRGCYFTRAERAAVQSELAEALTQQSKINRAYEIALEAPDNR